MRIRLRPYHPTWVIGFFGLGGMKDAPVYVYGEKSGYSQLLDRDVAVVGILEKQFAAAIMKKLPPETPITTP